MTMKAVGTAAMEMVQEVEAQFDEVRFRVFDMLKMGKLAIIVGVICSRVCFME